MAILSDLPEEIIVHVISYLDTEASSQTRARYEPTSTIFDAADAPLKQLSCASLKLRRLILPILFKHARIDLTACVRECAAALDGGNNAEDGLIVTRARVLYAHG